MEADEGPQNPKFCWVKHHHHPSQLTPSHAKVVHKICVEHGIFAPDAYKLCIKVPLEGTAGQHLLALP